MKQLLVRQLSDPAADAVSNSHADAISELQDLPAASMRVLKGVVLPPNTDVFVPHLLGRAPNMVIVSPPIGHAIVTAAGIVCDVRGTTSAGVPVDVRKAICLHSSFYVESITVNVTVF